ncbi:Fic family protein [Wenyingzhuangia sp. IMCC45574]
MKFEKPPFVEFNIETFDKVTSTEYSDFLNKTDLRYFYWDELKYRNDLPLKTQLENWTLVKTHRKIKYQKLIFGKHIFNYYLSSYQLKELHEFDLKLIGGLKQNPILPSDRFEYFKSSILQEAISSSQVEGATTTTEVAKDMLKTGRDPKNESEQMIFNNLKAIQFINEFIEQDLNFKFIIDLHSIMTRKTEAEYCSGDFRTKEVYVTDHVDGEVAHIPPDYIEVNNLMKELCEFINNDKEFIHPIVKASILHFMIGYIHPFLDGNGRTARALFYWYLIKKDYSLINNISISKVILESRTQYDKAFLKTENDENDLNYFINYSIKNLRIAFEKLSQYRDKKTKEREKANSIAFKLIQKGLNKRQADLIGYFYMKPKNSITLKDYSEKNEIVRQTASKDIKELVKLGFVTENKRNKPIRYNLIDKTNIDTFINN